MKSSSPENEDKALMFMKGDELHFKCNIDKISSIYGGCRVRSKAADSRSASVGIRRFESGPPHIPFWLNAYYNLKAGSVSSMKSGHGCQESDDS